VTPQSSISGATTANQLNTGRKTFMLIAYFKTWLSLHIRSESGQDLIEYAMLGGLIALALIGGGLAFSGALTSMASGISGCIDFNSATPCKPF
jgi:Flp pilus assembly pilin Flp